MFEQFGGLNRLLAAQPEDNVLVASLAERDAKIAAMTDAQRGSEGKRHQVGSRIHHAGAIRSAGGQPATTAESGPASAIGVAMDGSDSAGLSHRVSGTLGGTDNSRWTNATALFRFSPTVNPSAEMPPQNDPWLGGREGRDLRVDG